MSFEEKKNLLFLTLESAEREIKTDSLLHQNIKETDYSISGIHKTRTKLISVDRYRGRESIFKRPNAPIGQCLKRSKLPDYKRNPHKWTKYTLEDVEDTSDRTNMAAAFSFLKQIEDQRERMADDASALQSEHTQSQAVGLPLVRFNRSVRLREQLRKAHEPEETPTEDKPQFNGRRVLMPEYVVGQKHQKNNKRRPHMKPTTSNEKQSELMLDHLVEESESDE